MSIRKAREGDLKRLLSLNEEVFISDQKHDPDLDMTWSKSERGINYFTKLLNNPSACLLVAEDNGDLVGYIAAEPKVISYRKSKYVEVENMGVSPAYRSKGVGSELLQKCLEWAKSNGFQRAYLNAYFKNNKAIDFYKKNGFSEIDISLERDL